MTSMLPSGPVHWQTLNDSMAWFLATSGYSNSVILGPLVMGPIIDSFMMGVVASQFLHWYNQSRVLDRSLIQTAVYSAVGLAAVVYLVTICFTVYIFAYHWGAWRYLLNYMWFAFYPILDTLMIAIAQIFFTERAYKIAGRHKSVIIAVFITLLSCVVGGIGVCILATRANSLNHTYRAFRYLWTISTFAVDVVITTVVMYGLLNKRSDYEETDKLVKRLLRVSIESQLPPTIIAMANVIDYCIQGPTFYGVFFEQIQGKFYVIGMIYVLNSRYYMNRDMEDAAFSGFPQQAYTMKTSQRQRLGPATIHVQTETYVESHEVNNAYTQPKPQAPRLRAVPDEEEDMKSIASYSGKQSTEGDIGPMSQSDVQLVDPRDRHEYPPSSSGRYGTR